MLERTGEVEYKQAVGLGQYVSVAVKHRRGKREGDLFEFRIKRAHVDNETAARAASFFDHEQRAECSPSILGKSLADYARL